MAVRCTLRSCFYPGTVLGAGPERNLHDHRPWHARRDEQRGLRSQQSRRSGRLLSIVTGQTHAFRWSDGEMTDLGTLPGFPFSEGRDINKHGQVVGRAYFPNRAFFWENGTITDLGTLGGPFAFAVAINQGGQVVGGARTASFQLHAFVWENGGMNDLGALPGESASVARAINKRGQVAAIQHQRSTPDHSSATARQCPCQSSHSTLLSGRMAQ